MQGYRPSEDGGFTRRDGSFFDFAKLAEADSDRTYVFVVDEINRGNLAKVFGELMMLIEPDKRVKNMPFRSLMACLVRLPFPCRQTSFFSAS